MILIPSSQYLRAEIQNEIGKLPPSFCFLQNKRLFTFQLELLRNNFKNENIIISLPSDYKIQKSDEASIHSFGAEIYYSSPEISLGHHIAQIISEENPKSLKILHGDTLFQKIPIEDNVVVVSSPHEFADWDSNETSDDSDLVWAGYFSISDPLIFLEMIRLNNFLFNKAINSYSERIPLKQVEINDWYDFGHLESLHKSREKFTTERSFNSLLINKYEVKKTSSKILKLNEEYTWFKKMPEHLQKFLPNTYGYKVQNNYASYKLNFISGFSLSELMLHSALNENKWKKIINEINYFFRLQVEKLPDNSLDLAKDNIDYILHKKNLDRIDEIIQSGFISDSEELIIDNYSVGTIHDLVSWLTEIVLSYDCIPAYCHGDLCLSNMIYLSRSNILKLIDPRGILEDKESAVGDQRYELAKISHSVMWDYDRIIAGDVTFIKHKDSFSETTKIPLNKNQEILKKLLINDEITKLILRDDIQSLTALLFISMIPLHADSFEKQISLFANGLKICKKIKQKKDLSK